MNVLPSEIFFEIASHCLGKDRWPLFKTCRNAYSARLYSYPENLLHTIELTEQQMDALSRLKLCREHEKSLVAPPGFGKTLIALSYLFSSGFLNGFIAIVVQETMIDYWIHLMKKSYPHYLELLFCLRESYEAYNLLKKRTEKIGIILMTYPILFCCEENDLFYPLRKEFLALDIQFIIYDGENPLLFSKIKVPSLYLTCSSELDTTTIKVKEAQKIPEYDEFLCRLPQGNYLISEIQIMFLYTVSCQIKNDNKAKKILILLPYSMNNMVDDVVELFSYYTTDVAIRSFHDSIERFNNYQEEHPYVLILSQRILLSGYGIFPDTCIIPNHPSNRDYMLNRILQERNPHKIVDFFILNLPSNLA